MNEKRLFFGMDITAPWPDTLPFGRIIEEGLRHMTLAFLGKVDHSKLEPLLVEFPVPPFKLGFAGKFDQCIFLPKNHPHVVAWHVHWLENDEPLIAYQKTLSQWLVQKGFPVDQGHPFYSHVTLSRKPFNLHEWKKDFTPLPMLTTTIHLYESLGNSKYKSYFSYPLVPPFEELEHTADIAYVIRGYSLTHIFQHAQAALAFSFPDILDFHNENPGELSGIEDVVIALNRIVTEADHQGECPFKAVSFHGSLIKKNGFFEWEMIIDV